MNRIKQQAPSNIFKSDDPPNFQNHVANDQLEKPISKITLKYNIGGNTFAEHFVVKKNLKGPILGLHFMRHNSLVIDTTHALIPFRHLTMQATNAAIEGNDKPQLVFIQENKTVPLMTTKTIIAFVGHPSEWNTTGTLTPEGKFTDAASLQKSPSISTKID